MSRRLSAIIVVSCLAFAVSVLLGLPAPAGETRHRAVVSANPVDDTPHVLDGRVKAIAVAGDTVVVGGQFTEVREADSRRVLHRRNIFAFDKATGRISRTFAPGINGTVHALAAAPGKTVLVGGSFNLVNGHLARGLARLHTADGTRVSAFRGTGVDGEGWYVLDVAVHGRWAYVGGRFSEVNGVSREALARLDVRDGDVDADFDLRVGKPRAGSLKVMDMAVSPDGSRLAVDGTFTEVAGKRRYQLALIDTAASPPRLAGWATEAYTDRCRPIFATYLRGIDFAPDGSYFVVVTTGGTAGPRLICDSAARFETGARGTNVRPTWVNRTGGDSLYSVAVTGAAVYVGGHQRWMDNPHGRDSAGPGAKPRPGIAALGPRTGKALAWNPTRTRGHGVEALVASRSGLYVGSDTEKLGREYHARLGMFPTRAAARP